MNMPRLAQGWSHGWLAEVDPRVKLAWLVVVSIVCVIVDSLSALVTLNVLAALPLVGLRLPFRAVAAIVALLMLVVWTMMLSQAMFYSFEPRTTLVEVWPEGHIGSWRIPALRLYREGAVFGAVQSLRMLAGVLAGLGVCLSTSPERLLAALSWLRVPPALAFVTTAALRFLPESLDAAATVRRARQLRRPHSTLALGDLWGIWPPLLALALRRSANLATSVTTRGFRPGACRTFYPQLWMTNAELIGMSVLFAAGTAIAAAKALLWFHDAGQIGEWLSTEWLIWIRAWL